MQVNYPGKTLFQKQFGGKMVTGLSGIVPFATKRLGGTLSPVTRIK